MSDQQLSMFRYVVGAAQPLRLAITRPGSRQPDIVEVEEPFAVIGRGEGCHIRLEDDDQIDVRHVYLQVIGGRVACVDLFSSHGLEWDGPPSTCWLSPEHRVRVGRHHIQLFDDGWFYDGELPSPLDFKPRQQNRAEYGVLPEVELGLVNVRQGAEETWPINRIITLVGRDRRCRIRCADQKVSRVHCALLLVPSGLWAVDLAGRGGIRVNREASPFGFLHEEADLRIGKYTLRAHYPRLKEWKAQQAAVADRPSPSFLTRQHAVFPVEEAGDILIVRPQGDIREFFYQDIQMESNRVMHLLKTYPFRHVIIDFQDVRDIGSIVLEAVAGFCRTASGGAALCNAPPDIRGTVRNASLAQVWPFYETRAQALAALQPPGQPVPGS